MQKVVFLSYWTQICIKNGNKEKIMHDKELGINKKNCFEKKENIYHYIRKGQMTFISFMSLKVLSKDPVLFKVYNLQENAEY